MTNAYAQLTQRRQKLEELVTTGCDLRIRTARELFRLSLVELYTQGYWQEQSPRVPKPYAALSRVGSVSL